MVAPCGCEWQFPDDDGCGVGTPILSPCLWPACGCARWPPLPGGTVPRSCRIRAVLCFLFWWLRVSWVRHRSPTWAETATWETARVCPARRDHLGAPLWEGNRPTGLGQRWEPWSGPVLRDVSGRTTGRVGPPLARGVTELPLCFPARRTPPPLGAAEEAPPR